jgi:Ser/Thr protein kinase RdoA (MazF antagonist)
MTGGRVAAGSASKLTPLEVEDVVRTGYGFRVESQKRLGGEIDQNVWVRTDDGSQYLFKASVGEVDEVLLWQQTVLSHLERAAPDIPVSRLVLTRSGEGMLALELGGRRFVVRLLSWLPGSMLAELDDVPLHLLTELGTVAARLTLALAQLSATTPVESHHWDIRRARAAVDEALPFVTDTADRQCVTQLMALFDRALPRLETLPTGVVHQDLNDFNVLAQPGPAGRMVISGVLDINDSLYTVRVAELAVAVAYALLRQEDPLEAAAALVGGFHATAPLTEEEVTVIFPLAAARLCVNATTWTRRTTESHHPYGRERMRHTWPTLRKIATISPADAEQRLLSVCGFSTPSRPTLPGDEHA